MAKKKSKAKKRSVGTAKHAGAKSKVVKKKTRPASKAKKVAKKATKPARNKAKASRKPATTAKNVAKKKVAKPKSVAPVPIPPVVDSPPSPEHGSISEPTTPTDADASPS